MKRARQPAQPAGHMPGAPPSLGTRFIVIFVAKHYFHCAPKGHRRGRRRRQICARNAPLFVRQLGRPASEQASQPASQPALAWCRPKGAELRAAKTAGELFLAHRRRLFSEAARARARAPRPGERECASSRSEFLCARQRAHIAPVATRWRRRRANGRLAYTCSLARARAPLSPADFVPPPPPPPPLDLGSGARQI